MWLRFELRPQVGGTVACLVGPLTWGKRGVCVKDWAACSDKKKKKSLEQMVAEPLHCETAPGLERTTGQLTSTSRLCAPFAHCLCPIFLLGSNCEPKPNFPVLRSHEQRCQDGRYGCRSAAKLVFFFQATTKRLGEIVEGIAFCVGS